MTLVSYLPFETNPIVRTEGETSLNRELYNTHQYNRNPIPSTITNTCDPYQNPTPAAARLTNASKQPLSNADDDVARPSLIGRKA
jgi:hypothetical protein